MLRAYVIKDTTVISLIQQNSTFKKMTSDDVLDKIINHEMLVEEANRAKNLSKGITSSKKIRYCPQGKQEEANCD
jgi:hypothetical protein